MSCFAVAVSFKTPSTSKNNVGRPREDTARAATPRDARGAEKRDESNAIRARDEMKLVTLIAPLACAASCVGVIVLGPTKRFERTVLGAAYVAMHDAPEAILSTVCAWAVRDETRGSALARRVVVRLCDAPNPLGQMVYLTLALGGHAWFARDVETRLLDAGGAGGWTLATGSFFGIAVATWIAACASDPGTITRENVDAYLRAYAYDEVLYHRKRCRTLGVDAPARSKWCTTTERRVARFDHFCVWINNTVGANNLRYFLGFLAAQLALVAYVSVACAVGVRNDLARKDAWSLVFAHRTKSGEEATLMNDWALLYRFIAYHYASALALFVFCVLITVLLAVFLAYNVRLAMQNVTTNETFKRDALRESVEAMGSESKIDWDEIAKNTYDRGIVGNLKEVFFPPVDSDHPWRVPCSLPRRAVKAKRA